MIDDIYEILEKTNTPERAACLSVLSSLLADAGYSDELFEIYNIIAISDSSTDATSKIEALLCKCVMSLSKRLGITFNDDAWQRYLPEINDTLSCLIDEIEDYDDYQSLLVMMDEEEPNHIQLANLVSLIKLSRSSVLCEALVDVDPRAIQAIRRVLNAKAAVDVEDTDDIDSEQLARVARFLELCPDTPASDLFANLGWRDDLDTLINRVALPEYEDTGWYVNVVAHTVAGIAVAVSATLEDASRVLEHIVTMVVIDVNHESFNKTLVQIHTEAIRVLEYVYSE